MKRILVLGGSGMLGSHIVQGVVDLNLKNVRVTVADVIQSPVRDAAVDYLNLDLSSYSAMDSLIDTVNPTIIVHACALENPPLCLKTPGFSVDDPRTLTRSVKRLVTTSALVDRLSRKTRSPKRRVLALSSLHTPVSLEGVPVQFVEKALESLRDKMGVCIVKIPYVVGYRQKYQGDFVNGAVDSLLRGIDPSLPHSDSKLMAIRLVEVVHLVLSLLREADESKFSSTYWIPGANTTIGEIARAIVETVGYGEIKHRVSPLSGYVSSDSFPTQRPFRDAKKALELGAVSRFSKNWLAEVVEFRKEDLKLRGYRET